MTIILLFWIMSLLNMASFLRGQDHSVQFQNIFLSFKSEQFVSYVYLPICFITTAILFHEKENPFLLVRFKSIFTYSTVKAIQLLMLSIICTFIETFIFLLNTGIYSFYSHFSIIIDFHLTLLFLLYFPIILCLNTLNLLLLQTIVFIVLKNRLIGFVCMLLFVFIDQFLNRYTGISVILDHGMVIHEIRFIITDIINQLVYCIGELFLLLAIFYYSFDNKEFY